MIETRRPGFLAAAIDLNRGAGDQQGHTVLPFHKALVDFEMLKLELAMAPMPAEDLQVDSLEVSQLAHTPLMLASYTRLMNFDYAVHRSSHKTGYRKPRPTRLLLYRSEKSCVQHLELDEPAYAMTLAMKLASQQNHGLAATELLMDLADYYDTDEVVQFVEQGLKLLAGLNNLRLLR